MGARPALRKQGGIRRLDRDDFYIRVHFLQESARARYRAARADARHKDIDGAVGIRPDLGACGLVVSGAVVGVVKLSGDKAAGVCGGKLIRFLNGARHALWAVGEHELCAVGGYQLPAFKAHRLGHDYDHLHAELGCVGGDANARVAAGRLDDERVFGYPAGAKGGVEHLFAYSVLGAARGIQVFELRKYLSPRARRFAECGETHEGSAADKLGGGTVYLQSYSPLSQRNFFSLSGRSRPMVPPGFIM